MYLHVSHLINIFIRHILAVLHFNENVNRESKKSKDGLPYYHITYPKFKLGDEVVREIPVPPTYGKNLEKVIGIIILSYRNFWLYIY